ncbi:hypothetical protein H0H93_003869 [Arthromyces matolae]|nr:hypothetical protein H0H93_003869 [Arthromyces matolae]
MQATRIVVLNRSRNAFLHFIPTRTLCSSSLYRPVVSAARQRNNPKDRLQNRDFSYRLERYSTQKTTSFSDPHRKDIFYHVVEPPTTTSQKEPSVAVSFLETPPTHLNSSTIIGWLPVSSHSKALDVGLKDFRENPLFRNLLHDAIKSGLANGVDDIQINGALQLQDGWMHIHDDRNIPPLGRIGDPDDIIATVLVRDSKILPETYQPMPAYRICTSDGLTTLTPGLAQHLKSVLLKQAASEPSV